MSADIKILSAGELQPEVAVVVGTRPGIVMFAPIIHELRRRGLPHFVIHTGQHYSPNMDAEFFRDLELPAPDYRLEETAAHRTHGGQTAHMLVGIERILLERKPRLVLVGGDANSNLAGALAARKLHVAVGHVEAGERSFDWSMPEEHNRRIIDHISDYLFVTGDKARLNVEREMVRGTVVITGNPIVDASRQHLEIAQKRHGVLASAGVQPGAYGVLTMHREENVDHAGRLRDGLAGASAAAAALSLPLLFFMHPRTEKRLSEFGMSDWARELPWIRPMAPAAYLDFLAFIAHAGLVFTDSGGVQQEACIHHVGCVTLRNNTEWTETLEIGANRLAGCDPKAIVAAAQSAWRAARGWVVPFGHGDAAERIVDYVAPLLTRIEGGA
ncbi:MAG: UDP-N-acetylglucosamine 2-epimerase (non-hydrolyzing) [Gammaproteobacteria bacterium]|nr:UDP-N-acetylglucosamine 2-epimerase (non-hydrolyzing) [Gammaproteobacteria bacterium]